jgi:uncharacterized protein
VVFEKKGPGCCELDLRAGRITRRITTKKERQFYGHGVFSKDGKRLFCTEAVVGDASYKGVIAVRDGGTYALLGTLDSHGHAPHDLHMIDDGKTLVVTNGGGTFASGQAPSVVWLDWQADKLVRRRELNSPKVNAGHLAVGEGNALTVVSAPRTGMDKTAPTFVGGVSFLTNDKLHTSSHQVAKELRGEVLSVAIDPTTGIAATTCPDGGKLLFWDAATGGLLASRDLAHARGVALTLDGQWFAVTHGKDALVTMFGTRSLKPATKAMQSWMTGSHVITHKLRSV